MTNIVATHRSLLSRLLPGDNPDALSVRQGQFHTVVIGSDRVVCFPRTRAAADRLPARAASLRALAGLDPGLRTPEPLLLSEAHGGNETPFLVLTRIPGQPLENDALDDERVAETVAAQYVTLLAALYRAGADATARAVLPQNRADRWHQFAEGVKAELFGLMSHSGRLKAQRELAALDTLPHLTQAVVHGDLGAENVVWVWQNGMPHLSGILDWDDVALGDQAEDLAAVGASYSREFLERVLALGGWSNHPLLARIAAIRDTFALQQALYAIRDGDEEELADGLAHYR
ncbi:viomycin phosphotransferase [Mycolicibacterium fortuitum]|nr:viomycin phosphotransferase [Mycolicibacterium fortuitum]MCA4754218.1 viomycin phosphotransferase [Mycolicibacterium fortuitum]MDG5770506.1 viomycin phosphotransferase [Mycolicibacterium fortuitum]MDG5781965.1 viomycin phosphotransferase [Mycolicibacterium fortuitum]